MVNIHDVIKAFIDGHGDKIRTENVFIDDVGFIRVLYSYGRHFPLCVITNDGKALVNTSKYSVSTSKQQTYVRQGLSGFYGDIIELSTSEIKEFLDKGFTTYNEYTESKI